MKIVRVAVSMALAIALQSTLARYVPRGTVSIDLVLIVGVYAALTDGPATGLLAGTLGGLVQDTLSSGIIGIGALAKTVVGYLSGVIGTQFIVTQALPRFVVFFGATLLHATIFMGLYELLELRAFGTPYAAVLEQALGNAVIGIVAFQVSESLPGAMERRRLRAGFRR